jgi:oxaloacetate decarboxylase gamma subunit
MFGQSAVLSLLGMGVVFAFLTILIVFMTLVAKVIHALGWDADVQAPNQSGAAAVPAAPSGTAQNPAVVAAISAAVNQHRKSNS